MPQVVKKQYVSRNGEWVEVATGGSSDGPVFDQVAADPLYVNVTGDTMTGPLTIDVGQDGVSIIQLNGTGTGYGEVGLLRNGIARWLIRTGTNTETGNDTGADLHVISRHDDGTSNKTALNINRATGLATVTANPTATLGIATKGYVDTKAGAYLPLAGGTLTGNLLTRTGGTPIDVRGAGIVYSGATNVTGTGNVIAMRWGSPNINGGVDNVNTMVLGTVSARKWKSAITGLKGALGRVKRLRPVEYTPRELDGSTVKRQRHAGLVADEVRRVMPGAVVGEGENGSVNYLEIVPVLVAAVQELSAEIDALKAQIGSAG
jgi:Chaperone of endosialidase